MGVIERGRSFHLREIAIHYGDHLRRDFLLGSKPDAFTLYNLDRAVRACAGRNDVARGFALFAAKVGYDWGHELRLQAQRNVLGENSASQPCCGKRGDGVDAYVVFQSFQFE